MFTSFRSPYAYLALERAAALAQRRGLRFRLKPVLPMVMRGLSVPSQKRLFIARDAARQSRVHGVPLGKVCDPLGPGIAHCMALFAYAEQHDKGLELAVSLGRGIWSQARDVTDKAELAVMVERAGLDWSKAEPALQDDSWRPRVADNRKELLASGLWGVPSFVLGEHAVWGQDRLPLIDAWLG